CRLTSDRPCTLTALAGPDTSILSWSRGSRMPPWPKSAGTRVVTCVAGTLSRQQIETLARCRIDSVTICLDPDRAGDNNIAGCAQHLIDAGIPAYIAARLPDRVDPDEYICTRGIGAWNHHVSAPAHAYHDRADKLTAEPGGGWTDPAKDAARG